MANEIKYGNTKLTYTEESVVNVKVSDGTVLSFPNETKSTVTNAKVLAAYVKLKGQYIPPVVTPPVVTPPVVTPPVIIVPPAPGEGKQISLKDLAQLKDVENVKFAPAAGILPDGASWSNLKNVTIAGGGKVQLTKKGITLGGKIVDLTVDGLNLSGIPDYQISYPGLDRIKYTGAEGSFIDGVTLQNIVSENSGQLFHTDGSIQNGSYFGVVNKFRLLNSVIRNCDNPGSIAFVTNAFEYEILNNVTNNINLKFTPIKELPNGIHNSLFHMKGYGKMNGNRMTNHQGNAGRFWLHSPDGKGLVEADSNFIYNVLKFSAFEIQVTDDMIAGGAKIANAKITNNIAGQISTSKDWDGMMLDIYKLIGGTLEYVGNRGWDMNSSQKDQWHTVEVLKMINKMYDIKTIEKDNIYYPTKAEALKSIPSLSTLL